jgi:hypothetical protein
MIRRAADVRFCRIAGVAFSYTYALACISLSAEVTINSALRFK